MFLCSSSLPVFMQLDWQTKEQLLACTCPAAAIDLQLLQDAECSTA